MRLKRLLALGAAGALIAAIAVTPASAHGRRHHSKSPSSCPVCTVYGCTVSGRHTHNGLAYCGYHHESGYCDGSCRPVCTLEDCTELGRHTHNGLAYCGYHHESGYCDGSCRPVCTVEGCTEAGRHTHSGLAYCGYHHESGYCDGSCLTASAPVSPAYSSGGGCHGHHGGRHC